MSLTVEPPASGGGTPTVGWTEICEELSLARTRREFAAAAERLAREIAGCEKACLFGYALAENELLRPAEGDTLSHLAAGGDTLAGRCVLGWERVQASIGGGDAGLIPGLAPWTGEAVAVPVKLHGSLVGVLTAASGAFPAERVERLEELARVLGVMQEHVARREDVVALLSLAQNTVAAAVESLPGIVPGHVARVASLSSELGALLDLSARSRELLWQAAHFHDVGKLTMHGRTAYEVAAHHPQAGASALAACRPTAPLAALVAHHHDRWDGKRTQDVPIEAWVLTMAEDFDSYWMEMQGGQGVPLDDVVAGFFQERARNHNPLVVDALSGLVDSGRLDGIMADAG